MKKLMIAKTQDSDPAWNNVTFMINDSIVGITDLKGAGIAGTGAISRIQSPARYSGLGLYGTRFQTNGRLVSTVDQKKLYLGSTYSIEFSLYLYALPAANTYVRPITIGPNSNAASLAFTLTQTGRMSFGIPLGGNTGLAAPDGSFTTGHFTDVGVYVNGGNGIMTLDGEIVSSGPVSAQSDTVNSHLTYFGQDPTGPTNYNGINFTAYLNGIISQLRITKGVCRHSGAFARYTTPFLMR